MNLKKRKSPTPSLAFRDLGGLRFFYLHLSDFFFHLNCLKKSDSKTKTNKTNKKVTGNGIGAHREVEALTPGRPLGCSLQGAR